MKIRLKARSQGSIVMVTLLTAIVIGVGVASYLQLVSNQYSSTMRSLAWNTAIPVAEAGIEEALTHLNDDNSLTANNWSSTQVNGQTVYRKQRDFVGDGSYFSVTISNASTTPVIFSQASVPGPLGLGSVRRALRVTTAPKGLFRPAVFTKRGMNLGSDFVIDSFDSSDPGHSTNGKYDPDKAKANGNLASTSTEAGAIQIQDSKIIGHVYTPPTGAYNLGQNGMVGDQAFQSNPANAGKVQPGFYSNDLNTTIPDVKAPPSLQSYSYPIGGLVNGVLYDYILASGGYQLPPGTTLKGKILVLGEATLYVPKDARIQFGSSDVITISSSLAASLSIYNASAADAVFADVSNASGMAAMFSYYGLPSTAGTKAVLTGSGTFAFAGTIYAPNQDVVLNGPSSGNQNFIAAVTANSFAMNGRGYIHFDEALTQSGGTPKFVIDSYTEIASSANY